MLHPIWNTVGVVGGVILSDTLVSYTRGIMPQTQPLQVNLQQVNLQHAHHCVYDLHYHFVFVVKYRRALLRPEVEEQLVRISHEVAERYEFEIETLGADLNHVHLLCSAPPKVAPSEIVRIYKSITTVQMFRALPQLKKELWGGKLWTGGFYVSSVGQRGGYADLRRYIEDQGRKPEAENLRLLFPTTGA